LINAPNDVASVRLSEHFT